MLNFLEEDMPHGDITPVPSKNVIAEIIVRESCVLAGVDVARLLFEMVGIKVLNSRNDGEWVKAGEVVLKVGGRANRILQVERLALNLLMRMSGIATTTAKMVELARRVNPKIIIAATRKTTPGFRLFEKMAVEIGGGDTHRFSLSDCVMLKDNHLAVWGGIEKAMEGLKASFTKKIEVETKTIEEVLMAAKLGADIVMLDNFTPEMVELAVKKLESERLREKVILEVSGRITPENVEEYASKGVDVISSGYITHSARAIDFSLRVLG
nr:carboxylating nicotinate-nucleotide diphosphorylase [Archaeoglobus neptunius]